MNTPNRSLWSKLRILLFLGFTGYVFVLHIIPKMSQILTQESSVDITTSLWLMWTPIVGYLLIMINIYLVIKYFIPSTTLINSGILQGTWVGLVWSLLISLAFGMIMLFGGFDNGLATSLKALSVLLIFGLILGFIWGMILSFVGGFRS